MFRTISAGMITVCLLSCNTELADGNSDVVDSLFMNPILTSGPDPWVFQKDSVYYLTFTTGSNITIYQTSSLSDMSQATHQVAWTPPASGANSRNIWAPEIHQISGKWYIYFAADDGHNENHRMWVLESNSENPLAGEWVNRGQLQLPDDRWAIDGTIFEHQDQLYFLWSGWEGDVNLRQDIYICKMSDPATPTGERVLLSRPELSWETNGTDPTVNEGPQVIKKGSNLFIVYSAGGCWTDGYSLGLLSAEANADLLDPRSWTKRQNPVFVQNPGGNAFGPGHNGFFRSMDGTEDWIIYHANPLPGQGCGNKRSIRIQPFSWDEEDFPLFGKPCPLDQKLIKPSGEY